jgi:hypothetical protein
MSFESNVTVGNTGSLGRLYSASVLKPLKPNPNPNPNPIPIPNPKPTSNTRADSASRTHPR